MKLSTILWLTRGENWGFELLLQPSDLKCDEEWLIIYEKIFNPLDTYGKDFERGKIKLNNKDQEVPYCAIKFLDLDERKDRSHRPITHRIIIFGEESEKLKDKDFDGVRETIWRPKLEEKYAELYNRPVEYIESHEVVVSGDGESLKIQERKKKLGGKGKSPKLIIAVLLGLAAIALIILVVYPLIVKPNNTTPETKIKTEIPIQQTMEKQKVQKTL